MGTRRHFLGQAMAAGMAAQGQSTQRPNVLLMIADDLGLHTGAYGDSTARTPQLDRLASEGVRFTNAFCTTASCSPSRSVILTGMQNHSNGQYGLGHADHNFYTMPKVRLLPELLKEAGYRTGVVGKLHVNTTHASPWDLDKQGETRHVTRLADTARSFVQQSAGRPWYLHVGFGDPHRAAVGFANQDYSGVQRTPFDAARIKVPSFLPDLPAVRSEVAEYYEAANRMDQGVGQLLNMLRETGQADNTLVIFISDNGMPFPNAKTTIYDAGVHLPMIVRSPRQTKRGVVNQAMVSFVDLAPTILDWTGVSFGREAMQGRSVLPILEQENPAGREEVYFSHTFHEVTMYYPMRGMRTRQYKYIRNLYPELEFPFASDLWNSATWQTVRTQGPQAKLGQRTVAQFLRRPEEELYDVVSDPDEVHNLAGVAAHQATLRTLREKVTAWREATKDPWTIQDDYRQGRAPRQRTLG